MKFEDDFVRLNLACGPVNLKLPDAMDWPPPERIFIGSPDGFREAREGDDPTMTMRRIRCSAITNEQRAEMTHVARGADYRYEEES